MRSRLALSFGALAAVSLVVAACGSDDAKNAVTVVSTSSTCEPATTTLAAGKTTFKVVNKGDDVTELYVLQGNKTLGEVENVGAGTSRTLSVSLTAGEYDLACKPGMKGDGIKARVTVTGTGGAQSAPARKVDVDGHDFAFGGLDGFTAKKGETVEFELHNTGTQEHELELIAPDGSSAGEVSEVKPGATGEARITFSQAGTYTYKCGVSNHDQLGMKGTFTVTA